eukprot:gb/GECH01013975.1/.p1 GENE.gb/GECH01013975.1/~~gb/GECH01013975.1/.p1  ORF type:complete len:264 (+),score=47.75 gb/GECH01013975.1/:1-792(+)
MLRRTYNSNIVRSKNFDNIISSKNFSSAFEFNNNRNTSSNFFKLNQNNGFNFQSRSIQSRRKFTDQEKKHWSSAQWEYFDNLPNFPIVGKMSPSEKALKKEISKPLSSDKRTVILLKNIKALGFQYQEMTIPKRKAAGLVSNKKATYSTPESRAILLDNKPEEFHKLIQWKAEKYNIRFRLSRGSIYFYRRAPSYYNDLIFNVTKKDIINRVWNVLKVPLKEEQLEFERPIKKPGQYRVWVDIGQNPKVKLRVYVHHDKHKIL